MYSHRLTALSTLRAATLIACAALGFFIFSNSAQAADTLSSSTYIDADGNGTVDNIKLTFDENIDQCNYEAGDWTVNTAGSITAVITGINTSNPESNGQGDCNGTDAVVYLSITADSNETGGATAPVVSYANAGTAGSLSGATTAQITAKANATVTDAAAPTVVSTSPTSGAVGISSNSDITITFSESMDTTFAEATEFSMSPDPGSFSAGWATSNTVLTLTTPTLVCGSDYTVTTVEAEIIASAGSATTLVTTGAQDGDWTFSTINCGGASSTPVRVTSFDYAGPLCTTANTHSFTVVGSNIASYLASADDLFVDADWQEKNIEGTGTIDVTLEDGDDMAYIVLKSDTGMNGNTFSFELDNWNTTCATDDSDDEVTEDEDETTEDEDVIVPVSGVSPGDVIHSTSSSAVYYVTETYGRRVFINEQTFFTWFDSFDVVKEVSESTLSALPLQGNMLPKAGVVLVKIQSSPTVYFLGEGGEDLVPNLREIRDEATAIALFGSAWADYVIDVEPTFFTKFGTGLDVEADEELGIDLDDMKKRVDLHD